MVLAFWLMLIVVVPVIGMAIGFAWRYRATANRDHAPDWDRSRGIEIVVWGVPAILVAVLGTLVWTNTHQLDPYRPLDGNAVPTEVQAVALDWKWLFIYPDLGIATVNELAFPADRPLHLRITSDVAMNSFMIPALGGQIYAMAGMETQINLRSNAPGRFQGRNMQFSGAGFPEQTFDVLALSDADFTAWAAKVRRSPNRLDLDALATLRQQSIDHPVMHFHPAPPSVFESILADHAPAEHSSMEGMQQ